MQEIPGHNYSRRQFARFAFGGASFALASGLHLVLADEAFGDKLDEEIAAKQAEVDRLASEISSLQLEIEQIVDRMHSAEEERDAAKAEGKQAEDEINAVQEQIEQNTQRIEELQNQMAEQMRLRYRSDDLGMYEVVMGSTTFEDFVNRWNMLQRFNETTASSVETVRALRRENETKAKDLEVLRRRAEEKASDADKLAAEQKKLQIAAQGKVSQLESAKNSASIEVEQLAQKKEAIALEIARAQAAAGNEIKIIGNPHDLEPCPEVVPYAKSKIGAKYVFGKKGPDVFDCSGLTQWCYKQIGIKIPSGPSTQYKQALREGAILPISLSEPGDVLMRPGHVGLVTEAGGAQFIHAPGVGKYVEYSRATKQKGFLCALRFPRP